MALRNVAMASDPRNLPTSRQAAEKSEASFSEMLQNTTFGAAKTSQRRDAGTDPSARSENARETPTSRSEPQPSDIPEAPSSFAADAKVRAVPVSTALVRGSDADQHVTPKAVETSYVEPVPSSTYLSGVPAAGLSGFSGFSLRSSEDAVVHRATGALVAEVRLKSGVTSDSARGASFATHPLSGLDRPDASADRVTAGTALPGNVTSHDTVTRLAKPSVGHDDAVPAPGAANQSAYNSARSLSPTNTRAPAGVADAPVPDPSRAFKAGDNATPKTAEPSNVGGSAPSMRTVPLSADSTSDFSVVSRRNTADAADVHPPMQGSAAETSQENGVTPASASGASFATITPSGLDQIYAGADRAMAETVHPGTTALSGTVAGFAKPGVAHFDAESGARAASESGRNPIRIPLPTTNRASEGVSDTQIPNASQGAFEVDNGATPQAIGTGNVGPNAPSMRTFQFSALGMFGFSGSSAHEAEDVVARQSIYAQPIESGQEDEPRTDSSSSVSFATRPPTVLDRADDGADRAAAETAHPDLAPLPETVTGFPMAGLLAVDPETDAHPEIEVASKPVRVAVPSKDPAPVNVVVSGPDDAVAIVARVPDDFDPGNLQTLFKESLAEFGVRLAGVTVNGARQSPGGARGRITR